MTLADDETDLPYDEADLIERAKAGDRDALGELRMAYGRAIYGCIRVRSRTDADAEDVDQDTWLLVLTRISRFDPARAPFEAFAKFWAGIALAQFYHNAWRSVVLISTLIERYPGLSEADIWDLIAPPRPARRSTEKAGRPVKNKPKAGRVRDVHRVANTCDLAAYDAALRETFRHPIPPHQYVVFGFMQFFEWRPRELVAEFSSVALRKLETRLEDEFARGVMGDRIRPFFTALRDTMSSKYGALPLDANTRRADQALLERITGDIRLAEYCSRQLSGCISHWWLAVARRIANSPAVRAITGDV